MAAASAISPGEAIVMPVRNSASGTFGVNTVARRMSRALKTWLASGSNSASPLLATITGSTTSGVSGARRS